MRITKKSAKVYKTDSPLALIGLLLQRGYPMTEYGKFEIGISTVQVHRNGTIFCDAVNGNWYHDAVSVMDGIRDELGEVMA